MRSAELRSRRRPSSSIAIRSGPGAMRFRWSARRHRRAMANAHSPLKFRFKTPTHSARRNDRPGKDFHRLAAGWVCSAARDPRCGYGRHCGTGLAGDTYESSSRSLDLLLAVAVAAACCGYHGLRLSSVRLRGAAATGHRLRLRKLLPTSASPQHDGAQDAKSFTTTGPLVAEQQADIAAERNGRVVSIAVQIGDHVKTGQLLALLDDRTLRSACDSQKARMASAKARCANGSRRSKRQSRVAPRRRDARRQDHQRRRLGARKIQAR